MRLSYAASMGSEAYERFMASTDIDYERWHDGVGYDLEALGALGGRERAEAQQWLLARAGNDWRDLEGLLALGSDTACAVVAGLESAVFYGGLSVALDLATEERTPAMVDALFRACFREQGEGAVHAAARLAFIQGAAKEAFDWDLRSLFLRFNTPDRAEREAAFRNLCALCKVDPAPYVGG